jgi:hypothetical protein
MHDGVYENSRKLRREELCDGPVREALHADVLGGDVAQPLLVDALPKEVPSYAAVQGAAIGRSSAPHTHSLFGSQGTRLCPHPPRGGNASRGSFGVCAKSKVHVFGEHDGWAGGTHTRHAPGVTKKHNAHMRIVRAPLQSRSSSAMVPRLRAGGRPAPV